MSLRHETAVANAAKATPREPARTHARHRVVRTKARARFVDAIIPGLAAESRLADGN